MYSGSMCTSAACSIGAFSYPWWLSSLIFTWPYLKTRRTKTRTRKKFLMSKISKIMSSLPGFQSQAALIRIKGHSWDAEFMIPCCQPILNSMHQQILRPPPQMYNEYSRIRSNQSVKRWMEVAVERLSTFRRIIFATRRSQAPHRIGVPSCP